MPKLSRSTVSIRLFDKKLDPEYLTQHLGCTPSFAAKAGDRLTRPNGKIRVVKTGYWRLEYGERDNIGLEEQIAFLLAKLTDDLNIWQEITKDVELADLFCGLFMDNWNEGFEFSPNLLKKIAERNLKISFDVYSPTNTWRSKPDEESLT